MLFVSSCFFSKAISQYSFNKHQLFVENSINNSIYVYADSSNDTVRSIVLKDNAKKSSCSDDKSPIPDNNNFNGTSVGIQAGYSGLYSTYYGFCFLTNFSDTSDLNFAIAIDNYTKERESQLTLRANVGRNILLGDKFNLRLFVGLGGWEIGGSKRSSNAHSFPILDLGISIEMEIFRHIIPFLTVDQQFWIPYSFFAAPLDYQMGCRFYF